MWWKRPRGLQRSRRLPHVEGDVRADGVPPRGEHHRGVRRGPAFMGEHPYHDVLVSRRYAGYSLCGPALPEWSPNPAEHLVAQLLPYARPPQATLAPAANTVSPSLSLASPNDSSVCLIESSDKL